jgi:hypothetical protein
LGKRVTDTKLNTSKLLVTLKGDPGWVDFASQPNVFRTARAEGFNTAVIGWHHPYCRILGNDLSDCAWDSAGNESISVERHLRPRSLAVKALFLATWQSRAVPFMLEPELEHESHIAVMRYQIPNVHRMLQNRKLNLVLLHLVVPHPPGIWDITKRTFTTGKSNYTDNLQLASDTLGQIRRDLEKMGDWDRSTILVSSDHPYRPILWQSLTTHRTAEMVQETGMKAYPLVPFLLKLPSQHKKVLYDGEFNNLLTSDLILQLLNGNLPTIEDTVNWLHAHPNGS